MTDIKAALIGNPVKYSLSPLIHNFWIQQYGLSGTYEAIAVEEEDLKERVKALAAGGYAGFNVTVPHKVAVAALCDECDEAAQEIGAVNTVSITPEGKLLGFNTDAYGFWHALTEAFPEKNFTTLPALVLGAGGAARAICYALRKNGVDHITIANRTFDKADAMADHFDAWAVPWEERELAAREAGLIVNATVLGMKGKMGLNYRLNYVREGATICDIVYVPQETKLLAEARERGIDAVGGLGMLLHQARPAFEKWYGILPDVSDALYERIKDAL